MQLSIFKIYDLKCLSIWEKRPNTRRSKGALEDYPEVLAGLSYYLGAPRSPRWPL